MPLTLRDANAMANRLRGKGDVGVWKMHAKYLIECMNGVWVYRKLFFFQLTNLISNFENTRTPVSVFILKNKFLKIKNRNNYQTWPNLSV